MNTLPLTKTLGYILLFTSIPFFVTAQTLSAGDLAFIGFNSDGDDHFAIVLLRDITNKTIYFTDREVNSTSGLEASNAEGTLEWNTGATTIPAGTVVIFTDIDSPSNTAYGVSHGTISTPDLGFNFAQSGDGILAFIGTNETTPTTFLAGIQNIQNPTSDPTIGFGDTTGLNLTCAAFTITRNNHDDGGAYISGFGTRNAYKDYLQDLKNIDNWNTETSNGSDILPFPMSPITLACNTPTIIGMDLTICNTDSVLLSDLITGNFESDVKYGATFGVFDDTITTKVAPSVQTTYFVLDSLADSDCKDTAKIVISVNPQPTITARDSTIDIGTSIDLSLLVNESATGTLEYGTTVNDLNSANNTVSPIINTTYIVRDTVAATTCAATTNLLVTVNSTPINLGTLDPCNCGDPENRKDGTGTVTLFHDYIEISDGGIAQTWRLATVNSGSVLNKNSTAKVIGAGTGEVLSDLGEGRYRLDFWHLPGVGFDATIQRASDGHMLTITGSCATTVCFVAPIPTLSEWGLLILALLILNLSIFFIQSKKEILV